MVTERRWSLTMIHMICTREERRILDYVERDMDVQLKSTSESERERRERSIVASSLIFMTVHGVHVRFRSFSLVDFAGGASRRGLIQD